MDADHARFEALFRAHYTAVLEYASRRVPDRQLAADVAAETFTTAWRRLDSVPAEPLPWLLGTARRTLANQRRAGRRRDALNEEILANERDALISGGGDPADIASRRQAVLDALQSLSEADREILRLAAWEQLDPADIAVVLDCARPTVAVRLFRARRRLADALQQPGLANAPRPGSKEDA